MPRLARPPVNRSRFALLGALALQPMSGYDLRAFFARNLAFFWSESYGQIYPMLKALAAEGLIERVPGGDRRRTPYRVTAAGHRALAEWLTEPVVPAPARVEILLKLFFARFGDAAVLRSHVEAFRTEHRAKLVQYAAVAQRLTDELADEPDIARWRAALSYGRHLSEAMVAWSDETLGALGTTPPADDAGPDT